MAVSGNNDISRRFSASSVEIYAETLRDLVNPNQNICIENRNVLNASSYKIESQFDIAGYVNTIHKNFESSGLDQRIATTIHTLKVENNQKVDLVD